MMTPVQLIERENAKQEQLSKRRAIVKSKKNRKTPKATEHKFLMYPSYSLLSYFHLEKKLSSILHYLHSYLLQLNRQLWSYEKTLQAFLYVIGQALLVILVSMWISVASNEPAIAIVGIIIAMFLVLRLFQDSKKKLQVRKQEILFELPILLTRLTLLVGAGETVQQAFMKTIQGKEESKHPLIVEWCSAVHELRNGASFTACLEKMNRNCSVQQIAVLTTIILLNYRRGGEHFIASVHDISISLWEARKNMAKTKGEEASSKLIFPLVGVLFLIMVLIMTPAIFFIQFL